MAKQFQTSNLHSISAFLRKRQKRADTKNVQASKGVKSKSLNLLTLQSPNRP